MSQHRAIEDAMDNEPVDEPLDVVDQQDDAPPADEAPAEPELILGKFKSHDDLAQAYKELEKKLGQRAQPEPDPAPAEEYDESLYEPAMAMPLGGVPQTMEQLDQWLGSQPAQAAQWVLQTQQDPELLKHALDTWAALDGTSFANFVADARVRQAEQAWEERIKTLEQRLAPHDQAYQQQVAQTTQQMVAQSIPDWNDYGAKVTDLIKEHPGLKYAWAQSQTPADYVKVAQDAYGLIRWQEMAAQQAATPTPTNQPAPPRAATRTRQAAPVADDGDEAEAIIAAANSTVNSGTLAGR